MLATKKISTEQLVQLLTQFKLLVQTRIPIDKTFQLLIQSFAGEKRLHHHLKRILARIKAGDKIYQAFAAQKPFFPDLFIGLVRAGEMTGRVDVVLEKLADYYAETAKLRKKIIQTLTYPAITLIIAFAISLFMLLFVIPSFAEIYASMDVDIPAVTQLLLDLSQLLNANLELLVGLAFGLFVILFLLRERLTGIVLARLLHIPVLSGVYKMHLLARYTYTMYIFLDNRIPILDAIQNSAELSKNLAYRHDVKMLYRYAKKGELKKIEKIRFRVFSRILVEMLLLGEQTGKLNEMFFELYQYYQGELDHKTQQMMRIIEPLLILVLGAIIGTIVIALYVPMFEISMGIGG